MIATLIALSLLSAPVYIAIGWYAHKRHIEPVPIPDPDHSVLCDPNL